MQLKSLKCTLGNRFLRRLSTTPDCNMQITLREMLIKLHNFRKETQKLKVIYYLKATILALAGLTIKLAFFLLIITYTVTGETVTAETVFFVQQSFLSLRSCITVSIPLGISSMAELWAAMKRFYQFLNAPEYSPFSSLKKPVIDPQVYLDKVSASIHGQEILKSVSLDHKEGVLIGY